MKFFVAFVALVAVASAMPRNKPLINFDAELQAIIDAIHSPSTDPATAILLQEQLNSILGIDKPEVPIVVGPAIIGETPEEVPIVVGPAIIDEAPAPAPVAASSSPVVQITINIGSSQAGSPVVIEGPTAVDSPVVVERPEPEQVFEEVDPSPVIVVDKPHTPAEPVLIAPINPAPAMVLPDILN